MKYFIVSLAIFLRLCGAELSFKEWMVEYGEDAPLATDNDHVDREKVYYANVERIRQMNAEDNGAEFRVNQFAAMTPGEFRHQVLMQPRQPVEFDKSRKPRVVINYDEIFSVTKLKQVGGDDVPLKPEVLVLARVYVDVVIGVFGIKREEEMANFEHVSQCGDGLLYLQYERMEPTGASTPLPDSFDWTTHDNVVTSVKNQGALGTCWAFSTIGNVEGQWGLKNNTLASLSVQQVVTCDGEKDPQHGRADCGVFGGWPYLAYQYLEKAGGIETDTDYAYCTSSCYPCAPAGYNVSLCGYAPAYCRKNDSCAAVVKTSDFVRGLQVVDWKSIGQNETEIAYRLMEIGPLSVMLDASLLSFYHSGVYHPHFCSKTSLDHAVLLVGFGEEKDLFSTKPYWLIKNSWGVKWGLDGYFRILRGEGMCGINTQATTSVLK